MTSRPPSDVTLLLSQWRSGKAEALDELLPLVYDELRALAAYHLRQERQGHTLQATALANEVYLRLMGKTRAQVKDRAHFMAVAAQAIRRVLVDHSRAHRAAKRISPEHKVPLDAAAELSCEPTVDLSGLDQALTRLAELDPRQATVVELRYFGGLTVPETAEVLGVSEATVAREWRAARMWLAREMDRGARDQQ